MKEKIEKNWKTGYKIFRILDDGRNALYPVREKYYGAGILDKTFDYNYEGRSHKLRHGCGPMTLFDNIYSAISELEEYKKYSPECEYIIYKCNYIPSKYDCVWNPAGDRKTINELRQWGKEGIVLADELKILSKI